MNKDKTIPASPLVSIITVVYNGEKYLQQTIDSVASQTYGNIEYLIIDGASKDGTLEIIKKNAAKIDYWCSEPDKGLYDAMNKGIKKTKGEIIGMINSDDWYEPNAVALIVNEYLRDKSKKIFHGDRFDVQENGNKTVRKYNPSKFKFLYYGMTYNHPSMFIHKDIYQEYFYNINLRALSDYEFVLAQYLKNNKNFCYIPNAYVNYRLDGLSARIPYRLETKEGYESRKNAGMNTVQASFYVLFSTAVRVFFKIKRFKI